MHAASPAPAAIGSVTFAIEKLEGSGLRGPFSEMISPDGKMILFRGDDGHYHVRKLNALEAEPVDILVSGDIPFWSPDSQSVAFPSRVPHIALMKTRIPNGAPQQLAVLNGLTRGGSWSEHGDILISLFDSLHLVPADGRTERKLEVPGLKEGHFYSPEFLPGGDEFLFTFVPTDGDGAQVYIGSFRDGKVLEPKLLLENETAASYTPAGGGRILFVRNDNLYCQRLDRKGRRISGDPELLEEHVASIAELRRGYFSVSRTGDIVWRSGGAVVAQATVFDRQGNRVALAGTPAAVNEIRLSPDAAAPGSKRSRIVGCRSGWAGPGSRGKQRNRLVGRRFQAGFPGGYEVDRASCGWRGRGAAIGGISQPEPEFVDSNLSRWTENLV